MIVLFSPLLLLIERIFAASPVGTVLGIPFHWKCMYNNLCVKDHDLASWKWPAWNSRIGDLKTERQERELSFRSARIRIFLASF
jgi:hypothetical protein